MTDTMPEPPDRALVGVFHPNNDLIPFVFERDNTHVDEHGQQWYGVSDEESYRWADVLSLAAAKGWQVVRLYRADDPAITDAFNAGVNAAADAIEKHAEGIGWYEGGGVWADAIEEARKATAAGSTVSIERPDDERIEVHVNGQVVATANHDEHGWSGMDVVEKTALAVARALGGTVTA